MKKILQLAIIFIFPLAGMAQDISHVFVILNSKPDKEVISAEEQESLQKTHLENIGKMAEEGRLSVAGPFEGGGGIFILNTNDKNQANQWLQSDPAIRAKRWDLDVMPVRILKGGACLAKEPYEMVTYHYYRIKYINDIANYKSNQTTMDIWQDLVKIKGLIFLGSFSDMEGGVIVSTQPLDESQVDKFSDQIELIAKNLWVAKGSFCE